MGTYSEKQARKYLKVGLIFLIPFVILFITSSDKLPFYIDVGRFETSRGMLMGIFTTFSAFFIIRNYGTWKSGLTGERTVIKNISDKLSAEYSLFNDVILKDKNRGNIDHIIVGPTGIFAIETKNNKEKVSFDGNYWNGVRGNPSQQAKSHAVRINGIMKASEIFFQEGMPFVRAIVVFSNRKAKLKIDKEPEFCKIIQIKNQADKGLADYILNEPERLSIQEIYSIEQLLKTKIKNFDQD